MGFQHGMIQSVRLIQQNFGNPEELGKHVRKIVESLAPYFDKAGIRSIFHYLVSFVEIEREELIQIVDEVSNQNHPNMKTVYDQLIELGVEKGIEKGVESGREKGILISLLNGFDMGLTMSQLQKLTEYCSRQTVDRDTKKGGRYKLTPFLVTLNYSSQAQSIRCFRSFTTIPLDLKKVRI